MNSLSWLYDLLLKFSKVAQRYKLTFNASKSENIASISDMEYTTKITTKTCTLIGFIPYLVREKMLDITAVRAKERNKRYCYQKQNNSEYIFPKIKKKRKLNY